MIGISALSALFGDVPIDLSPLPKTTADSGLLHNFLLYFFGVLASIALLVLVIAGLRYVNATGDTSVMIKTRNTIIYAAVGLIVSMTAFAMVTFVLNNL